MKRHCPRRWRISAILHGHKILKRLCHKANPRTNGSLTPIVMYALYIYHFTQAPVHLPLTINLKISAVDRSIIYDRRFDTRLNSQVSHKNFNRNCCDLQLPCIIVLTNNADPGVPTAVNSNFRYPTSRRYLYC